MRSKPKIVIKIILKKGIKCSQFLLTLSVLKFEERKERRKEGRKDGYKQGRWKGRKEGRKEGMKEERRKRES